MPWVKQFFKIKFIFYHLGIAKWEALWYTWNEKITIEESMEDQKKDINNMTLEELQQERETTQAEIDLTKGKIEDLQKRLEHSKALLGSDYHQILENSENKIKQSSIRMFACFGIAALFGLGWLGFMALYNILGYTLFGCMLLPLITSFVFAGQGYDAQQTIKSINETLRCIEVITNAIEGHEQTQEQQIEYLASIDKRINFLDTHKFINLNQEMKSLNNKIKEFNNGLDNIANKAKSINRNFDGINDTLEKHDNEREQ